MSGINIRRWGDETVNYAINNIPAIFERKNGGTTKMNHNYKLTDFKNIAEETDTDIKERIVSVSLSNVSELPVCIIHKTEKLINTMISVHEEKSGVVIPLEDMELGMYLEVDTQKRELSLNVYISYSATEECITGKEVIVPDVMDNSDYLIIKKFFFMELLHEVAAQIVEIEKCA